jgi:hypothetical protein
MILKSKLIQKEMSDVVRGDSEGWNERSLSALCFVISELSVDFQ